MPTAAALEHVVVRFPGAHERGRQWVAAILGALRCGLTHSPQCRSIGKNTLIAGCPFCDHVRTHISGAR